MVMTSNFLCKLNLSFLENISNNCQTNSVHANNIVLHSQNKTFCVKLLVIPIFLGYLFTSTRSFFFFTFCVFLYNNVYPKHYESYENNVNQ